MKCNNCGNYNPDGVNFCNSCGAPLTNPSYGGENTVYGNRPAGQHYQKPARDNGNKNLLIGIGIALAVIIIGLLIWFIMMAAESKKVRPVEEEDSEIELVEDKTSTSTPAPAATTKAPSQAAPSQVTAATNVSSRIDEIACMDFSSSYVSDSWLATLSKKELRVARNAIYARHGRYFKSADLQQIFNRYSWYTPYRNEVPVSELNKYERSNITTIQSWE